MNETQRLGKIKSLWNQWNDARVKHPQVAGGLFRELDRNINPEAYEDRIVGVTIIGRPGELD